MDVKFFYDIPHVKEIIGYILIPFLVFIIICSLALMIYSARHKDHESSDYKYHMNLYTLIISTLLVAALFAILFGFALAFKKQVEAAGIESIVVYIVEASPLLPFLSLLALLIKTIKLIKNRPVDETEEETDHIDTIKISENPANLIAPTIQQELVDEDNITVNVDNELGTNLDTPGLNNVGSILNIPPASNNGFSQEIVNNTINNPTINTPIVNPEPTANSTPIIQNSPLTPPTVINEVPTKTSEPTITSSDEIKVEPVVTDVININETSTPIITETSEASDEIATPTIKIEEELKIKEDIEML